MKINMKTIWLMTFWSITFIPVCVIYKNMGMGATTFVFSLLSVVLLIIVSYNRLWSLHTLQTYKGLFKFSTAAFALLVLFLYLSNVIYISHKVYQLLMAGSQEGSDATEYQIDDTLGIKHVPNARTLYRYSTRDNLPGRPIPLAFDENGFRIPLTAASQTKIDKPKKTDLLFLGDSFTFGAACYAEETFPLLVAKATNRAYINAGVSNYGLAQMLILAEKLIPEYKPHFVIVQYSPWLVSRATSMVAPVNFFLLPTPYIAQKNNDFVLELPIYNSHLKSRDINTIKLSYRNKFLNFLFQEAFPFASHEIWNSLKTHFLLISGKRLRPATNLRDVERYAYNKIKSISEKNNATLILLNIGDLDYTKTSHDLFRDEKVRFADAEHDLNEFLEMSPSKDYCSEFCHWIVTGQERILVDAHPNPVAHKIIANSIIKAMKQ